MGVVSRISLTNGCGLLLMGVVSSLDDFLIRPSFDISIAEFKGQILCKVRQKRIIITMSVYVARLAMSPSNKTDT